MCSNRCINTWKLWGKTWIIIVKNNPNQIISKCIFVYWTNDWRSIQYILLWAVPVSRRAVGRSENLGDENQSQAFWRRRFFFYFYQNLEGLLPPPTPRFRRPCVVYSWGGQRVTDKRGSKLLRHNQPWWAPFFSNEVSFFPRFKYHFFLYTISFFSYREKRNASKILIFQPLLLYVWAKFSKFKLIVLS